MSLLLLLMSVIYVCSADVDMEDILNNVDLKSIKKQFQPNNLNINELMAIDNNINIQQKTAEINWNKMTFKGFWSSFAMIIVSEIGDKTFFIAAILAMKHSRFIVWIGAASALFAMTVCAVVFGSMLQVIPAEYTHYGAGVLFLIFAIKLLWEGHAMKGGEASDELREVEQELKEEEKKNKIKRKHINRDIELGDNVDANNVDIENAAYSNDKIKKRDSRWDLSILIRSFGMTFISEIGDRSQIATIVLAAHRSPYGVVVGASLGHFVCTAIAVIGGKFLASRISEKNVTIIGGILFLLFAVETFIVGPME